MVLTEKTLAQAAGIPVRRARAWVDLFNQYLPSYGIESLTQVCTFIAQIGHESNGFKSLTENLNYRSDALLRVWPKHFTKKTSARFGRNRAHKANYKAIANIAYANRMGNGDVASGDGYRYRGRGLIMLTGKANYQKVSDALGVDFVNHPHWVAEKRYALLVACWYWQANQINDLAHDACQIAETKRINGGMHGIRDRERRFTVAYGVLRDHSGGGCVA